MTKSLVTGCAGFIGSHVCDELLAMGHEVYGLDDLSGGYAGNVPNSVEFSIGSICNVELVDNLFKAHKFDYVFHLAAYAAEGLSHFIRRFNYENNVIGSINLINASVNHAVKRFVFTSSIAVYGHNSLSNYEEDVPYPVDPYGIAKYAVEMDLMAAAEMFGLEYTIFRPHNVYGIRQNISDKYRNVIGIFMNQAMRGESMTIFGPGDQKRCFSHISGVAPAIAQSVELTQTVGRIFNIGGDTPYTINHLARMVSKAMGVEVDMAHLPRRNEVDVATANHTAIREIFGDTEKLSLEEGLFEMAQWVTERGSSKPSEFGKIEVRKNLPESWA